MCDRPEIRGACAPRIFFKPGQFAARQQSTRAFTLNKMKNLLEIDCQATAYDIMDNDDKGAGERLSWPVGQEPLSPDQALALDFVLGVLVEPSLSQAIDRNASDQEFQGLVLVYRDLVENDLEHDCSHAIDPRPETWEAIKARLAKRQDI